MEQRPVQWPDPSDPRSSGGRRRLRRASLAGAVILALVLAGVLYRDELVSLVTPADGGSDTAPSRPPPLVEAVAVEERRAEQRISATGTLQASEAVVITARTRGRVVEIRFQEGGRVGADDALVRLDRTRAQAAVDEARARVAETRSDLQRLRDLKAQQFASQSELDQAKAAADSAAAALTRAREDLRDRVIKAPFTGLVGRRMVSPGALLEPGTPVAELRRTDPLDLLFDVPETALGRIESGQRVRAATPALPGERFMGELTLVGTAVDPATRTLPLEATFPNPDGRLKPGMFLHAELITGERTLLSVPEAAVIARGPTQHVYVLDAQAAPKTNAGPPQTSGHQSPTVRRQTVKTGVRRDGWVEVTEGLEAGQRVVVAGLQGLRDGARVRTGPPGGTGGGPGAAAGDSQAERSNRQDTEPADGTGDP